MWPADLFSNAILIIISIYITNLGYLQDKSLYFTELSNGSIEELKKILIKLDITAIISEINN